MDEILANHPNELERFRKGDKKLTGFFMGQAMRASKGQADPQVLKKTLIEKLNAS